MKHIELGCQLGPYRVLQQLGAGGAGNVYLAEDVDSNDKVALKTLRPGAEQIEDIHARFIREITVAQKVKSDYVVGYRDCGVDEGVLYYAMQYLPWGSLSDILTVRGVLPWRETCECGIDIARGLKHFHDLGILHRDVKPANIFLSESGQLQLGDFGLARDVASHSLTMTGKTVGTGKYLAPEQARGQSDVDGRVDLYQLGCNLYQCMVGRTPFAPEEGHPPIDFMEMMRRHVQDPAPKLIDASPNCPPSLSTLVGELLAKSPDDRPDSASEVVDRLTQILQDEKSAESESEEGESLTERLRGGPVSRELSGGRLLVVGGVLLALITIAALAATQQ
ncbi:MAG: serine/threonine protein kinase [Rubripirellula sp.]